MTHTAFHQPEISWSRKRSVRIVIRIQIQITKKKISRASSSASPRLTSANGSTNNPFDGCRGEAILNAASEEDRGDRRGEVEAGDAGAHRDAEAGVGAGEQIVAEPIALGAEG